MGHVRLQRIRTPIPWLAVAFWFLILGLGILLFAEWNRQMSVREAGHGQRTSAARAS